jgi:hypothetical protein
MGRFPHGKGQSRRGAQRRGFRARRQEKERAVPGKTGALFKEEKGESNPIWGALCQDPL